VSAFFILIPLFLKMRRDKERRIKRKPSFCALPSIFTFCSFRDEACLAHIFSIHGWGCSSSSPIPSFLPPVFLSSSSCKYSNPSPRSSYHPPVFPGYMQSHVCMFSLEIDGCILDGNGIEGEREARFWWLFSFLFSLFL